MITKRLQKMDYKQLNLKEDSPTVELALAMFEIELERCKLEGVKVIKVLHGYGSHGKGGDICRNLRTLCFKLKKEKKIKDFLLGNEWDLANQKCFDIVTNLKNYHDDNDLGSNNPGITFVVL